MSETLLLDIDPVLLERVKRLATVRSWGLQKAIAHLLEHGLFACEAEVAVPQMDDTDAGALQAAIDALEQLDSDPGFSLIGRGVDANSGRSDDSSGDDGVAR